MAFDPSSYGTEWRPAFEAVESMLGGRIVGGERQARWRPVFFLEVERPGGEILPICFRGGRTEAPDGGRQIRHEFECLSALERNRIPVPRIYGFCEEPAGIVMERAPGRHDLATATSREELESVRDHFIGILADIHRLPTDDFEAFGLEKKTTPRDLALGDSQASIRRFRAGKRRPEPALEFLIDWAERNVPRHRQECCFITGDSGQFLFDEGRVTALLDMEIGYLGDPLADLGALFSRDLTEKMGDLGTAIDRYEAAIGAPVDRRTVLYHAIRWAMTTPLGTALVVASPPVTAEYVQYLSWYLVYTRTPLELIAHLEGIEIDDPELPDETLPLSPHAVEHDALQARLLAFQATDEFQAYEVDGLRRLALHLRQADRFGAEMLARDLDEAEQLLGHRPATWQERDLALEDLVRESDGQRNAELGRYFVRRFKREEALLAPAMRDLVGVRMQRLPLD